MANAINGPLASGPGSPGGTRTLLNGNATQILKVGNSYLVQILPTTAGTGSAFTVYDANANVAAQTITAITKSSSSGGGPVTAGAVVTISTGGGSNPFAVGNTVVFASVTGMTQINSVNGHVTAIGGSSGAWTITTDIDSSAFTAYVSGGTISSFGPNNQVYTTASWTANTPIVLNWPCEDGIFIQSIITNSVFNIAYS